MKEDQFEEMLKLEETSPSINITKKINQKIYKKTMSIVLVIILLILGGIYAIHAGIQYVQYNPYREDISIFNDEYQNNYAIMQHFLMNTYISMNYPNMFVDGFWDIESKGFGCYETEGAIKSTFSERSFGDNLNTITLKKSKYSISPIRYGSQYVNEQIDDYMVSHYQNEAKNDYLEELVLMPDSSIFEVYVTYRNPIKLDEWNEDNLIKYEYTFALIDLDHNKYFGIPLKTMFHYDNERLNEKYPEYELTSMSSDKIYTHYMSYLHVMLDHSEFLKIMSFDNLTEHGRYEYYSEKLKEAENHEVEIKGYSAFVKKNQLIEIINDNNSNYVYIQDVLYSSFER